MAGSTAASEEYIFLAFELGGFIRSIVDEDFTGCHSEKIGWLLETETAATAHAYPKERII